MQHLRKSVLFVLVGVFVASFAIAPAHAQSASVSASVPFDFAVGTASLKAGSYRIVTQGSFAAFSLAGGNTTFTMLSQGGDASRRDGQPYLVFTRYGTESFLSKIVFSENESYAVPRSGREKELSAHLSSGEQVAVLIEQAR
jgi:hypothetical protein